MRHLPGGANLCVSKEAGVGRRAARKPGDGSDKNKGNRGARTGTAPVFTAAEAGQGRTVGNDSGQLRPLVDLE